MWTVYSTTTWQGWFGSVHCTAYTRHPNPNLTPVNLSDYVLHHLLTSFLHPSNTHRIHRLTPAPILYPYYSLLIRFLDASKTVSYTRGILRYHTLHPYLTPVSYTFILHLYLARAYYTIPPHYPALNLYINLPWPLHPALLYPYLTLICLTTRTQEECSIDKSGYEQRTSRRPSVAVMNHLSSQVSPTSGRLI